MCNFIKLETKRLIIRDHTIEDLHSHHLIFSDERVMYYLQDIKTKTLADSKSNLLSSIEEIGLESRKKYFLKIESKDLKDHIGEIGYTVTDFTPLGKLVHLGYFIFEKHWGHGYVTEALKEIMRFAFEENEVFRITTGCIKENIGSERVMINCGMTKEGEYKQCEWHDGKMKDRVSYRLLKSEWLINSFSD